MRNSSPSHMGKVPNTQSIYSHFTLLFSLQRTIQNNAREQPLFCSLNILLGDVLVAVVAVPVVCFKLFFIQLYYFAIVHDKRFISQEFKLLRNLKVTMYLHGCLASTQCSASSLTDCRYLNPCIKFKLTELAIQLYQ